MNVKFFNALLLVFGPACTRKLLQYAGNTEKAWRVSASTLCTLGIDRSQAETLIAKRDKTDPQKEWERLTSLGGNLISQDDPLYPSLLKEIYSPPLALYTRGNTALLGTPSIAIVGTRAPSSYGRGVLPLFVEPIVRAGFTIVSGLAQGIDALAHYAALESGGNAIAVLGSGIDELRPKINERLGYKIIEQKGLIVSEYPLGTQSFKQHFPARNRIITGLALGVFVVESRDRGGSLISAQHALEQGRDVFALPGPVNRETSAGTNRLIQEGAKLAHSPSDILAEFSLPAAKNPHGAARDTGSLSANELAIFNALTEEPLHIDTITKITRMKPSDVSSLLTTLELKGFVRHAGGHAYERTHEL